jgi:quercetin dioxygenase-like cupin family protein
MPLTDPVLTGPGAGRTRSYGGDSAAELKIVGEQSGGEWAVVENRVRAGDEPPIHTHTREDETVYVLEGAITAYVGDQQFEVEAGSYAALPNNVPHGFTRARRGSPPAPDAAPGGCGVLLRTPRRERLRPGKVRAHPPGARPVDGGHDRGDTAHGAAPPRGFASWRHGRLTSTAA